jgi:phage shock protein A
MLRWIKDWIVERAIPPDIEDPAQGRIAEEAAENAIRQGMVVYSFAGLLVFAALAALLYGFLPIRLIVPRASPPPAVVSREEVVSQVDTDAAGLRQAREEWEGKIHQVEMERDKLQGRVAELEQQLEALAKQQPQAIRAEAALQDPADFRGLQSKIGALEQQVADLTEKLRAARAVPAVDRNTVLLKPARTSGTPVSAAPQAAYRCGDGRTVRDPASCAAAGTAPPGVSPRTPHTYLCADGRRTVNPADCRTAGGTPPRG